MERSVTEITIGMCLVPGQGKAPPHHSADTLSKLSPPERQHSPMFYFLSPGHMQATWGSPIL